ncbi:MAG: cysteine desulfurase family protein, partial [Butyricicoccus sp.]
MERRFPANPNSVHAAGKAAREEMARVTEQIAALTGASPAEVIFTSGATEANNLAIKGIAQASRHIGKHIISTPLEHSSVSGSLTALQERGWEIDLLSIGRDGTVDPEEVRELLRPDTVLVAICAVDSELGTIQPVNEIAALLADHPNCRLHVDATQAIGRIPVDFAGIDTLSFAPHKFGGICGSGVLLKRSRMPLEPQMNGGASTTLYRSGTPPALGLAASAALALQLACEQRENRCAVVRQRSERLRRGARRIGRAYQQPGARRTAYPQSERQECERHRISARAVRKRRVRIGQIRLLGRRSAVPCSVCCQP